jgi:hypothetical protein
MTYTLEQLSADIRHALNLTESESRRYSGIGVCAVRIWCTKAIFGASG